MAEDFTIGTINNDNFKPQRAYLWMVEFDPPGGGGRDLVLSARTANLPGITREEIEIPFKNSRFWICGKTNYETIDFSFMETEAGIVRNTFEKWNLLLYNPATGTQKPASEYKKDITMHLLSTEGAKTQSYRLEGAWPFTMGNTELTYDTNDPLVLTITFRYDSYTKL